MAKTHFTINFHRKSRTGPQVVTVGFKFAVENRTHIQTYIYTNLYSTTKRTYCPGYAVVALPREPEENLSIHKDVSKRFCPYNITMKNGDAQ